MVSFPTTHRRELSFPIKGTLALPLPGCQTRFRVVPDVAWDRIITDARDNNNLCHSKMAGKHSRRGVRQCISEEAVEASPKSYRMYVRVRDRGPVDNIGDDDAYNLRTHDGAYYASVTDDGSKLTVSREDIIASMPNSVNWNLAVARRLGNFSILFP